MKKTLKKEGMEWIRTILIGVLLAVFFRSEELSPSVTMT